MWADGVAGVKEGVDRLGPGGGERGRRGGRRGDDAALLRRAENGRILIMDLDACFITDRSSLWDFRDTEDEAAVFARIAEAYGVDVSDILSGNLTDLAADRRAPPASVRRRVVCASFVPNMARAKSGISR